MRVSRQILYSSKSVDLFLGLIIIHVILLKRKSKNLSFFSGLLKYVFKTISDSTELSIKRVQIWVTNFSAMEKTRLKSVENGFIVINEFCDFLKFPVFFSQTFQNVQTLFFKSIIVTICFWNLNELTDS